MTRIGALFVAVCIVLVAASVGVVVLIVLQADPWHAVLTSVGVMALLTLFNALGRRDRERAVTRDQIADLSRASSDIARKLAVLDQRLASIEAQVTTAAQTTRAVTDPLVSRMDEMGARLRDLGAALVSTQAPRAPQVSREETAPAPVLPNTPPRSDVAALVQDALDHDRLDVHLQPVFTLPQRRARYYEALSRLRTQEGELVLPANFLGPAERAGLIARIDRIAVIRAVQVVRRLQLKDRAIGVFANLSRATLTDAAVFADLLDFLDANRAIAASVALEFPLQDWRSFTDAEQGAIARIAALGFRFSLDHVADLGLDPAALVLRGVGFVKIPAALLLDSARRAGPGARDFVAALARAGVELIAEKVEREDSVVGLIDLDVRLVQGYLFSPPRPVRAEAFKPIAAASAAAPAAE